ncbi:MAG TPA: virulence-associated E family protein [Alphaproteobacteria bacterium]|nr:virulence-associated E family protein [Alphaproteobacteria bacterium]
MLDSKHPHDALERDGEGKLRKSEGNLLKAMSWAGIGLSFDDFALEYQISGLPGYGPRLDDDAIDELYLLIEREYYLKLPIQDFKRIVRAAARRKRFHPVLHYLNDLEWDGLERIDTWLIDFAGAPDTPFVRAVSRIVLIAAARRVRQPGCKFDEMLVLESPEGTEKSTAFRVLAGDDWFTDNAPLHAQSREVIESLRGRWIVECADLAGMRRAEVETLKAFLSRGEDAATLKYKEETTRFRRQCIFVGTTNESNYLLSTTGNRRFWPVRIERFDIAALTSARDQLWAEAALAEDSGESIRLPRALWEAAAEEQNARVAIDEWDNAIAEWLDQQHVDRGLISPVGPRVTLMKVAEGALGLKVDKLEQRVIERIAKCLRNAGWERIRSSSKRYWQPKEGA